MSEAEITRIGVTSGENNQQEQITGLLVYFEKLFFQVIEGEDDKVNRLFAKIGADPRHNDILRLKTEYNITERLFPGWSMKTINLDDNVDELLRPIKILLQTVIESHAIIEQYTQPTILKILNKGVNPLTVKPIKVERIILFADIMNYSAISEKRPIADMLLILNTYFEICSRIILDKGGEVNKFIGDGIMAYFSIEQADHAIQACLDILRELRDLRRQASADSPLRLLHSGFGIAQGPVIEGNMGSHYKTDYTIIGEPVNMAARLEGLTRTARRSLVVSAGLKEKTKAPWAFVSLGKYNLKGKDYDSEVYTIDDELVQAFKE